MVKKVTGVVRAVAAMAVAAMEVAARLAARGEAAMAAVRMVAAVEGGKGSGHTLSTSSREVASFCAATGRPALRAAIDWRNLLRRVSDILGAPAPRSFSASPARAERET